MLDYNKRHREENRTGKVEGKRDRGKQRITFLDSLCNSATGGQSKGLIFLSCLMTEMFGEAWPPMSVPDLAPDDDDDDIIPTF